MSEGDLDDRRRLKDNAAIEHKPEGLRRRDHAPPGHVGTPPALTPAGPGGLSSHRVFRSRWRTPEAERQVPLASRSPDGGERRFKRHDHAPDKERPKQGSESRRLDRGEMRRDFDRER